MQFLRRSNTRSGYDGFLAGGSVLFGAACFVIVVAGMRAAEAMLVPFLLSLFIAVLCSPPLVWLKERGVPNGLAILVIGLWF